MLKKEINNKNEKIYILRLLFRIKLISFNGLKPPDEMIVNAKLKASKSLNLIIFNTK